MDAYDKLIEGYKAFQEDYLGAQFEVYRAWAPEGQSPKTLMIGCSDSRVNPAILTNAGFGEIFIVNNVANIVPPYEEGTQHHKSMGAAIQYAVAYLKVEHIIVMGHSCCGGIAALMSETAADHTNKQETDYIADWISILSSVKETLACAEHVSDKEERLRLAEMEGVLLSCQNLASYPWVRRAVESEALTLHAWYFHIESGALLSYRPGEGRFRRVLV